MSGNTRAHLWWLTVATALSPRISHSGDRDVQRLVDLVAGAEIQSPVHSLPAGQTLANAESRPILEATFEKAMPAGWPRGTCRRVRRPEGRGRAMLYAGHNAHRCLFVLPAEPSTHYRIGRDIRTLHPRVDFCVIESRAALSHPERLNHPQDLAAATVGRFVAMSDLLFIHQLPAAEPSGSWQHHEAQVFTTPYTRSLVILLNDAESTLSGRGLTAYFDNLRVEQLAPTRDEELALLKTWDAYGERHAGIAKHGQLLPIHRDQNVAPPYDHNHDYREALFAPAPTDLTFTLDVPPSARLSFSCALHKMSRAGDSATFEVRIARQGSGPRQLFSRVVRIGDHGENWHWHEESLDLAEYAGERVHLSLATRCPEGTRGYALWGSPRIDTPRAPGDPPNIVWIAVDTLRADRLSCYGYGRPTSPHIDALAGDGVLFEQAISPSNWTSPAFASLFTGQMPSTHQVIHRARSIPPEMVTLAEYLRNRGWITHGIAYKAYLYNMGFEQGFDTFFNLPKHEVRAEENLGKALAFLERNADQRFFLFLHFNDPHQPFNQPRPYQRLFNHPRTLARFDLKLPFVVGTDGTVQGCRRCTHGDGAHSVFRTLASDLYDGEIAYLDETLGTLFAFLQDRGLYDEAVIALVADHGEIIWDRSGYFGHGGPTMGDELLHVPLIVKPPLGAQLARGKRVGAQVRTHDLMPTLLELAGLHTNALDIDAESLLPYIATRGPALADHRVAISENIKHDVLTVRDLGFKYVMHHPPGRVVNERLYDLRKDPAEHTDVAAHNPAVVRDMRLKALAHLMQNRHGRYLVVLGDGKKRSYRVRVHSAEPVRGAYSLHGLKMRTPSGDSDLSFAGVSAAEVVLVARFDTPEDTHLDIELTSSGSSTLKIHKRAGPEAFVRFQEGVLDQLIRDGQLDLHLFTGPPPATRTEPHTLSAQRLETLRALDYVR